MPEDVNVHSALEKAPTETSSQLPATSHPAKPTKPAKHSNKAKTAHYSKGDTTTEPQTSEPIHTLEVAKLLYGMIGHITSLSGSPHSPLQTGE